MTEYGTSSNLFHEVSSCFETSRSIGGTLIGSIEVHFTINIPMSCDPARDWKYPMQSF